MQYLNHLFPTVLPSLLLLVTDPDHSLRHGALHAVSELTHALYEHAVSQGSDLTGYLGEHTVQALRELVPRVSLLCAYTLSEIGRGQLQSFPIIHSQLEDAKVFKGAVGEMMRPAGQYCLLRPVES